MVENIICINDAFTNDECDKIKNFMDKYSNLYVATYYGEGENTKTNKITLCNNYINSDKSIQNEYYNLKGFIHNKLSSIFRNHFPYYNENKYIYCDFQLRKMLGPTREHSDNVSPIIFTNENNKHMTAYRIGTVVVTLSDTDNVFVFPKQKHHIALKKGQYIFFPPYWMYPHYTINDNIIRYSLTTWVYEMNPFNYYSDFNDKNYI